MEAPETDPAHGHGAAGRATGAAGGGRWRRARVAESAGAAVPEEQPGGGAKRAGDVSVGVEHATDSRGAGAAAERGGVESKSAVSRLVLRLEESYRSWQGRELAEEKVVYLYLDAIYRNVRSGGRVVCRCWWPWRCGRTARKCC